MSQRNPEVFRYDARILARVGEDAPVELFRCPRGRKLLEADIKFYTRDLSDAWAWWIERPTPPRALVGTRPIPLRVGYETYRADLTAKELAPFKDPLPLACFV